ncbi:unnamed protein product [Closterium sp. Yama58-4]|nr:unnamed protein product [Closterium sp. Yama58-4]
MPLLTASPRIPLSPSATSHRFAVTPRCGYCSFSASRNLLVAAPLRFSPAISPGVSSGSRRRFVAMAEASDVAGASQATGEGSRMKVLFVEMGVGYDQHGQNVTKAAIKACRNAITSNSIPAFRTGAIPGVSWQQMKLQVRLGVPRELQADLDIDQVKAVFPTMATLAASTSVTANAAALRARSPHATHQRALTSPSLVAVRLPAHKGFTSLSTPSNRIPPTRLAIRADSSNPSTPEPATSPAPPASPGFGLGGPGTWFGFGQLQELSVGRLAMVGFASALTMEVLTGKGVFGQLGIDPLAIRFPFLAGLTFLLLGGLLGGWVVINNPPDVSKAPPNAGAGVPRDPFSKSALDPLLTYTRGVEVEGEDGKPVVLPIASDLKPLDK